nr:MAG TPA: hypothetical protein [Bacteriophage sp.]
MMTQTWVFNRATFYKSVALLFYICLWESFCSFGVYILIVLWYI